MILIIAVIFAVNLILFYFGAKIFIPDKVPLSWNRVEEMVLKYKIYMFALVMVFLLNTVQNRFLSDLGEAFGIDLTPLVYGVEGNLALLTQYFINPILTGYLFFVYVFIYIFLIIFSISFYIYCDDLKNVKATVLAYFINYMVALPFFIFFPVYESWMVIEGMAPLLFSVNFYANDFIIWVNGVNNCMPSLHTSISVTVAVLSSFSGYRRWSVFAWVMAISVIAATLYLGIHWILDVIAGILLGVVAGYLGYKIDYNLELIESLFEDIKKR